MTRDKPFWSKVDVPLSASGCWIWTACLDRDGYGRIRVNGKQDYVHRFAYELLVGPIPAGLCIDHLCRSTNCVNPLHMEVVTRGENGLRGTGPPATFARRTHCIHGHKWTVENTRWRRSRDGNSNETRICRACVSEQSRQRRAHEATA